MTTKQEDDVFDLAIIGGGINGCGIARDAAGRGLSVLLVEQGDLACATSSASTKLFHGGLRYLEYFEFRLVREALKEREVLLRAMPHISWPMRFVLPLHRGLRFEGGTPASRLLAALMPWLKGRRPGWMIRLGLFSYDHLGGREILPGTRRLNLRRDPAGAALKDTFQTAFEYSDCWVQDARLVVLNARDAAERGATVLTRMRAAKATKENQEWRVTIADARSDKSQVIRARALVNATGPWVGNVISEIAASDAGAGVRLVRGSHIVTKRLFDHEKCYFFQGADGRIIFAIPYETEFTLIGTTDQDHIDPGTPPVCTEAEQDYLCAFASEYFKTPVTKADIVWTFSGVRPLFDDGASSASAATREYVLQLDETGGAPLLNVFGGKITTYRKLAEAALGKLAPYFPAASSEWTAGAALPGGDFPVDGVTSLVNSLMVDHPFLDQAWATRLVRTYGSEASAVLKHAQSPADLGQEFGATLTEAELRWLMAHEFALTAEDVVWRRTKLGLKLTGEQIATLDAWMASQSKFEETAQ